MISISPPEFHKNIILDLKNYILTFQTDKNNETHSKYLLCLKMITDPYFDRQLSTSLLEFFSEKKPGFFNVDYLSHSIFLDVLVQLSKVDRSELSLLVLHEHTRIGLLSIFTKCKHVIKGLPYLSISLAKSLIHLLKKEKGKMNLLTYKLRELSLILRSSKKKV